MAVVELRGASRSPLSGGVSYGKVGPYERLDGVIRFGVDPTHQANRGIVDLDKAARGADGQVYYEGDFCLIQPADPSRGNGRLLFDVLNRGRKVAVRLFNRAPYGVEPTPEIEPGDGFLMERGWTVAWCGWQWDVIRPSSPSRASGNGSGNVPALMGLEAPQALGEDGRPIRGQVMCQFQPVVRDRDRLLADRIHHTYPAADVNDPKAELALREWPDGPRTVVSRERWRFAHDENGKPVPDATRVWLEGGFEPGMVYEVVYRTSICPIVGTGLLAVRDTVSFLRYGSDAGGGGQAPALRVPENPRAGRIEYAYGHGTSQSGRFLRHFVYLGLNQDEDGRQVFDGLNIHVAGARRGEFNHRYAQPSVQSTRSFGHLPPFSAGELMERQRQVGSVPKTIATNTGAEYWRGDCSLLHTDPEGSRDIEPPDNVRIYYLSGTQHVAGKMPGGHVGPDGSRSANLSNVVDYAPLMRAVLVNLDAWVSLGQEPPANAFPRLDDGTAVPAASVLETYRKIPGAAAPRADRLPLMVRVDVGQLPPAVGGAYRTYVPAVDADGNELAGVRLPDLRVPVAAYTGWNPRDPETGGVGQIISMQGSTFPFSPTEILARYKDLDDYLSSVWKAVEALVAYRYLLAEDASIVVQAARERYEAYAK